MSKNYDNWERLVETVLRREHDREIALSHSRDPSSISSASSSFDLSFSSLSLFDHSLIDYFDLTLDHNEWKTMIPPYKQDVVLKSASLSFFLDGRTGKNCFLVGAKNLRLTSIEGCLGRWYSKPHPKSRFSEVTELVDSWEVDIQGWIKANMLSPKTLYAAYLVFDFDEKYANHRQRNHSSGFLIVYSRIIPRSRLPQSTFKKVMIEQTSGWKYNLEIFMLAWETIELYVCY